MLTSCVLAATATLATIRGWRVRRGHGPAASRPGRNSPPSSPASARPLPSPHATRDDLAAVKVIKVASTDAHEGPVWVSVGGSLAADDPAAHAAGDCTRGEKKDHDEKDNISTAGGRILFTTMRSVRHCSTKPVVMGCSSRGGCIGIMACRVGPSGGGGGSSGGGRLAEFRSGATANMANGQILDGDRNLVTCEQGTHCSPARITRTDLVTGEVSVIVDKTPEGESLSSPNDVVCHPLLRIVYFTDPAYGHAQGFRPAHTAAPFHQFPNSVYAFDETKQELTRLQFPGLELPLSKPNGVCFGPLAPLSGRDPAHKLRFYVTDSGAADGSPEPLDYNRPHHVYAFDCDAEGQVDPATLRTLCAVRPGIPDGIKTDAAGRVFVGAGDGVQVFDPETGEKLGTIRLACCSSGGGGHGATNMVFGGPGLRDLYVCADDALYVVKGLRYPGHEAHVTRAKIAARFGAGMEGGALEEYKAKLARPTVEKSPGLPPVAIQE